MSTYEDAASKIEAARHTKTTETEHRIAALEKANADLQAALIALGQHTKKRETELEARILALEKNKAE